MNINKKQDNGTNTTEYHTNKHATCPIITAVCILHWDGKCKRQALQNSISKQLTDLNKKSGGNGIKNNESFQNTYGVEQVIDASVFVISPWVSRTKQLIYCNKSSKSGLSSGKRDNVNKQLVCLPKNKLQR